MGICDDCLQSIIWSVNGEIIERECTVPRESHCGFFPIGKGEIWIDMDNQGNSEINCIFHADLQPWMPVARIVLSVKDIKLECNDGGTCVEMELGFSSKRTQAKNQPLVQLEYNPAFARVLLAGRSHSYPLSHALPIRVEFLDNPSVVEIQIPDGVSEWMPLGVANRDKLFLFLDYEIFPKSHFEAKITFGIEGGKK